MDGVDVGLLILRVLIGVTFAAHGYFKFFKGGRIPGTARWFDSMGMRPGKMHAYLAATTESVSGLLFAAGLLTPFAAAGIIGMMAVAGYTVNGHTFWSADKGWELNWVLGVVALSVATIGPGEYSLDHELDIVIADGWGLAIAGILGVGAAVAQISIFFRPPPAEEPAA